MRKGWEGAARQSYAHVQLREGPSTQARVAVLSQPGS